MDQDYALKVGRYLHRNCYKILKIIGQGGFGITYLAEETGYLKSTGFGEEFVAIQYPEKVVVKELYFPDICSRDNNTGLVAITNTDKKLQFEKLVSKQLEEGKILKKLDHPNIVKTRDIFRENETAYMVLDFIDAENLNDELISRGKLDKAESLDFTRQVLKALTYIHEKKILHLDISPGNILLKKNTNEVILIDFGASLTYGLNNHIASTTSNLVTGFKKHYAPNEQGDLDNLKEFDATFDTYAVGATLYHMLTGQLPPISSLVSSGRIKLVPPSQVAGAGEISDYLDEIVLKAIAPKYHDRFNSASEMAAAIEKEDIYLNRLSNIKTHIINNQPGAAYMEVERTVALFKETQTLTLLRNSCKEALDASGKIDNVSTNNINIENENKEKAWVQLDLNGPKSIEKASSNKVIQKPHVQKAQLETVRLSEKEVAGVISSKPAFKLGLMVVISSLAVIVIFVFVYLKFNKPENYTPGQPETTLESVQAPENKLVAARLEKADEDFAQKKYNKAIPVYESMPDMLTPAQMIGLAFLFKTGDEKAGIAANTPKSVFWYKKAAFKGDKDAFGKVGDIYYDYKKFDSALAWYHYAASAGDHNAVFNLGVTYCNKLYPGKNYDSSVYWFGKAAEYGVPGADDYRKKIIALKKSRK